MSIAELEQQRNRLKEIRVEHRELDEQIKQLSSAAYSDHIYLTKLKKRKLLLKDMIVKIESQLIPDLNA